MFKKSFLLLSVVLIVQTLSAAHLPPPPPLPPPPLLAIINKQDLRQAIPGQDLGAKAFVGHVRVQDTRAGIPAHNIKVTFVSAGDITLGDFLTQEVPNQIPMPIGGFQRHEGAADLRLRVGH